MKAIILAAGRGSRMKNLTNDRPKCLVDLKGKALLDWQLNAIRKAGIEEIGIVTGYKREMLASRGLKEFHNERWAETQMVRSLSCASEWLETDTCIVSYSDIFYESSALELLMNSASDLAITYDPNWLEQWSGRFDEPLDDAETFKLNDKSELIEIGKKPTSLDQVEGQYMGLLRFSPEGWSEVNRLQKSLSKNDQDKIHMTGILQKLISTSQMPIDGVAYEGYWGEVDTVSDLKLYELQ